MFKKNWSRQRCTHAAADQSICLEEIDQAFKHVIDGTQTAASTPIGGPPHPVDHLSTSVFRACQDAPRRRRVRQVSASRVACRPFLCSPPWRLVKPKKRTS